ncbi:RNA pseudouridine synthase [Saprospiraceae bacterium]|nr:RNA pseudouridine synthase [Saprospiraceae bacterium]
MNDKKAKVEIVAKERDYIVVNKPAGILSQTDQSQDTNNVLALVQKKNKRKLHLLTRLDRPVGGALIISKTKDFTKHYMTLQDQGLVTKEYYAIVEGQWPEESTTLENYLYHDQKNKKARILDEPNDGYNKTVLHVKVLSKLDNYSILSVLIDRGRFHQIRAQLSHAGFPVKGDVKYGARRGNKDRSIHLHATKIQFSNIKGEKLSYTVDLPTHDNLWLIASENIKKDNG